MSKCIALCDFESPELGYVNKNDPVYPSASTERRLISAGLLKSALKTPAKKKTPAKPSAKTSAKPPAKKTKPKRTK